LFDFKYLNFYVYLDDIKDFLDKGSYGKVYCAIRKDDKKYCVLKKIPKNIKIKDKFFAEKFKNHNLPHIVGIYDYFEDNENFNVVMELCENGCFSDFIIFLIQNRKNLIIDEWVILLFSLY
jgi:serine/threonine protein kinase